MPSRARLETALRNAHRAGDTQAAQRLATALKTGQHYDEPQAGGYPQQSQQQLARQAEEIPAVPSPDDELTPERSLGERASRAAGELGRKLMGPADHAIRTPPGRAATEFARGVDQGAVRLVDLFTTDVANNLMAAAGSDKRTMTLEELLNQKIGLDQPAMEPGLAQETANMAGQMVGPGVVGGAAMREAAKAVPRTVGPGSVTQNVVRQMGGSTAGQDAAFAAASGAGSQVGQEVGGEAGAMIGGLAGPAAITSARPAVAEATRRSLRGAEAGRKRLADAVADFAEIDSAPTLGQGTGDGFRQGMETLSSRILGGGPIRRSLDATSDAMQKRLATIADDISTTRGDVETGRVIQRGISGDDGFVSRWSAKSGDLWKRFDEKIPKDRKARIDNTMQALRDVVNEGQLGEVLNTPQLSKLKNAIDSAVGPVRVPRRKTNVALTEQDASYTTGSTGVDRQTVPRTMSRATITESGTESVPLINAVTGSPIRRETVSYGDLARLRSLVGQKLGSKELVSDIPRTELKKLYSALSQDIEGLAQAEGSSTYASWKRANNYTRSGHKRIDDFVERVSNKVDLDKVYRAVARGGDGTQSLNAIKRSLKPEEWEAVAGNVVRNLGKATPGTQNDTGEAFSVAKFLTDWNRLGESKNVLLSGSKKLNNYRRNLNRIASAADRFKESARAMANPSGTGQFMANVGIMTGAGGALGTGNLPTFGLIMSGVAANNGAARLMTNPRFVRWLAEGTTVKKWPAHIAALSSVAREEGFEPEVAELLETLKQPSQSASQPRDRERPRTQ